MWMWILISLHIITKVHGFANGNFPQSCNSLSPQHPIGNGSDFSAQTSEAPFMVDFERRTNPEDPITVVLRSNESTEFRGFMLEVVPADSGPLNGRFISLDTTTTRLLTCNGLADSAVSQRNNQRKSLFRVNWTAPEINQDIVFRATFVQDFVVFWENVRSTFSLLTTSPAPGTTTNTPEPSTTTNTPEPSTTTNTQEPSTTINTPEPSTTTNIPAPGTTTNTPEPSTTTHTSASSTTTNTLEPSTTTNTPAPSTTTHTSASSTTTNSPEPSTTTHASASSTATNTSEPCIEKVVRSKVVQEILQCQVVQQILHNQEVQQMLQKQALQPPSTTSKTTKPNTTNILLCQVLHEILQSQELQQPNTTTNIPVTSNTTVTPAPSTTTNTSASSTAANTPETCTTIALQSQVAQQLRQCQIAQEILQNQEVKQILQSQVPQPPSTIKNTTMPADTSEPCATSILQIQVMKELNECQVLRQKLQNRETQQIPQNQSLQLNATTAPDTTNVTLCQEVHQIFQSLVLSNTMNTTNTTSNQISFTLGTTGAPQMILFIGAIHMALLF